MKAKRFIPPNARSQLEDGFLRLWKCVYGAKYPLPVREHRFHVERKWRLDFAWPDYRLGVEIQGGQWVQGKHVRGGGLGRDCEKQRALADAGWFVYPITTMDLEDRPVQCIEQVGKRLKELITAETQRRGDNDSASPRLGVS